MKVIIWGSRGSIPAPFGAERIRTKIKKALEAAITHRPESIHSIDEFIDAYLPFGVWGSYGSNTSCVQIETGLKNEYIILDAGTGLRDFGNMILDTGKRNCHFHIFISHTHLDHLNGFPYFMPAYMKDQTIDVYGYHDHLEQTFLNQQHPNYFPVSLDTMGSDIRFTVLDIEKEHEIAGYRIRAMEQNHPGKSFCLQFRKEGKKIIYSTDSEHREDCNSEDYPFLDFYKDADLLIFDSMFSLMDAIHTKENWGHSSNMVGVELAIRAGVKHLCMFHTEPVHDDPTLDKILKDTRSYARMYNHSYPLKISMAYDGMIIDV
jgi:phosphoribosyl 1,2-cyclic phosphodiesterase